MTSCRDRHMVRAIKLSTILQDCYSTQAGWVVSFTERRHRAPVSVHKDALLGLVKRGAPTGKASAVRQDQPMETPKSLVYRRQGEGRQEDIFTADNERRTPNF